MGPEPETPQKLTRSDVKKIIIPKKSTLKKRALIEAKRKARIIEAGGDPEAEVETEDLPDKEPDSIFPKKDGDNSKLDTSNILSEGGRSSRHTNKELPQVGSGRAAASNATVAMAASTGRPNRFAKALERRAQLQEEEKKGLRSTRQAAASQLAIKAKKETPPKVNLFGPKGGRRYLTKDDSDLDNDNDDEVLPTPKRRGPGSKKEKKKSDSSEDEKDSNKNKKNSTPKRKPGRPAAKPAESASESSEEDKEDVKKNKKPIRPSLTKRLSNVSLNMMKPRKKIPAKVEPVSSRPRRGLKKVEPSEEEASSEEEPEVKKDNKKVITPSIKKKGKQPEAKPDPNFDWKSLLFGGEKAEIVEKKDVPNNKKNVSKRKVPETKTPKKPETPKKLVTPKLTKKKLPPLPKSLGPDEYDPYDEQLLMTPKIFLRTLKRSIIEDKLPTKPKESLEEGEIPKTKQVANKKPLPPKRFW